MLTVVGGTYLEFCYEPHWHQLYGSGLRGAAALSGHIQKIDFVSCVGEDEIDSAEANCATFDITPYFTKVPQTVSFNYYHPLSRPVASYEIGNQPKIRLPDVSAENILMYGLLEAEVKINGAYVVYDPQNWLSFKSTGSKAKHLALVLNKKEAFLLSGLPSETDLNDVGKFLLTSESADVVVIKNGSQGALVVEGSDINVIPVFETTMVWPIGSGDIFSAAFAWKWGVEKLTPVEAANLASRYTAQYCENRVLPLVAKPKDFSSIIPSTYVKKIYIAGPFFTMAERWLINEIRDRLLEFGNEVFSPMHDVGIGSAEQVVDKDLVAIRESDVLFAVISGSDPGTIFEIGYAIALERRVVILAENVRENDLTMFIGTRCEITNDFSTAIYKASW